jgi:hypothetical protein
MLAPSFREATSAFTTFKGFRARAARGGFRRERSCDRELGLRWRVPGVARVGITGP